MNEQTTKADVSKQLTLIGAATCGKTSILTRHLKKQFCGKRTPTTFTAASNTYKHMNMTIELGLWDTAGQEEYVRFRDLALPTADYVLICFAVDNRASFDEVKNILVPQVKEKAPNAKYFLAATKIDLRKDDERSVELVRAKSSFVTNAEGIELGKSIGATMYFECSSKEDVGVNEIFEKISEYAMKEHIKVNKSFFSSLGESLASIFCCK